MRGGLGIHWVHPRKIPSRPATTSQPVLRTEYGPARTIATADEDRSRAHTAMNQQAPEAQVDVFRTILDLENRGQQIEEIVQRIKEVFLISRGGVSLPDAVGVLDELHWSTTHLSNGVRALEDHLGIRRQPVSASPAETAPKANHALRGSTRSIPMPDLIAPAECPTQDRDALHQVPRRTVRPRTARRRSRPRGERLPAQQAAPRRHPRRPTEDQHRRTRGVPVALLPQGRSPR